MHEADDAYSIPSTWSCYWMDQFLTPALNTWISSKFSVKSIYYPSAQSCQFQACHANPSTWSASHESNKSMHVFLCCLETIVSQPSKCPKFMTFRKGCFVIHVEYKYLSEALETFYQLMVIKKFFKRWNNLISVKKTIMMRHSVNNNTRMGLVIFLCSNSNHLISLIPPNCFKF